MADQHDVLDDSAAVLPFPANTPVAPYYAVIFSSTRTDGANGYGAVLATPWPILFPAVALAITFLSFQFLGDGLRDALDVRADR